MKIINDESLQKNTVHIRDNKDIKLVIHMFKEWEKRFELGMKYQFFYGGDCIVIENYKEFKNIMFEIL